MIRVFKNDLKFKEYINSVEGRVLVDFYADWCGKCKQLEMKLNQLENINIVKVNIDDCQDTGIEYGVLSLPNLKVFENGEVIDEQESSSYEFLERLGL